MLIRNSLAAVNHGMLTGNYTVLRDLGTEKFRGLHQAGDLATAFSPLRRRKVDLSPLLVTDPLLTHAVLDEELGRLTFRGFFPTQPQQIEFDLTFQRANGGWLIDEVALRVGSQTLREEIEKPRAVTSK
jgi:hypothetical protein